MLWETAVNVLAKVLPTLGSDRTSASDGEETDELEEVMMAARPYIDKTNPSAPVEAMTKCLTNLLRQGSGLHLRKSRAK
jgi:hypothetical protein